MLHKIKVFRSRKLLDAAKDKPCLQCGSVGTTVAAHYQGIGAARLGKGRGVKPHDFMTADLCHKCHEFFDTYKQPNDAERALVFLLLCAETLNRRFQEGVITINNNAP